MAIALFVGRFQPFHKGHADVILKILEENDKVVVAIGSSQEDNTPENPLSAEERKEMIQHFFVEYKIDTNKYEIIEVPDIQNDVLWVDEIKQKCSFDVAYVTENEWTKKCFEGAGIEVRKSELIEPYHSTKIRKNIKEGMPWEHHVPVFVLSYLKEIDFEKRLLQLK